MAYDDVAKFMEGCAALADAEENARGYEKKADRSHDALHAFDNYIKAFEFYINARNFEKAAGIAELFQEEWIESDIRIISVQTRTRPASSEDMERCGRYLFYLKHKISKLKKKN